MKFSLRWLQDYIELQVLPEILFERLTLAGTEVEHVETHGVQSPHVVVAQILSFKQHPNADRLRVCRVNAGTEELQIVCGAPNVREGIKVPLALPGAKLPGGVSIKESKLRGELSQGMLCGASEIGLAKDDGTRGLLILDPQFEVGKKLQDLFASDLFFDVEITPNRPDLLSYLGMAREIAAIGAGKLKPRTSEKIEWPTIASKWRLELLAKEAVPYHTATSLGHLKIAPSPEWLQEKIRATGHRPINNVVDITNFVSWETGQPMHAFDASKLSGDTISIREAKNGESILLLDNKNYSLTSEDLVIADEKGPIDVAGVMGGKNTSVDETSSEIFLVAGWFNPARIRKTARRLMLSSDASYLFERRVDPAGTIAARDRAIQLLQEICGAKILSAPIVEGTPPVMTREISLRTARVEKVIGVSIAPEKIAQSLSALGLTALKSNADSSIWQIPSYRPDLEREIDLIEEIARITGMDQVRPRIGFGLNGQTPKEHQTKVDLAYDRIQTLRKTMVARGWNECVTDALISDSELPAHGVRIKNPLNQLYAALRFNLKDPLLKAAAHNLDRNAKKIMLFEIGKIYQNEKGATREPVHLGLVMAGVEDSTNIWQPKKASESFHVSDLTESDLGFYELKGTLDFLETHFQIPQTARLTGANEIRVTKSIRLEKYGIKTDVFYVEYDLTDWLKKTASISLYQALPSFPSVRRDIAVIVSRENKQEQIKKSITSAGIKELESVELFDVFADKKGEKIPLEKKSLAYALTYRATDRTLTEKEVNAWHEQIRERLKTELGCSFRDL